MFVKKVVLDLYVNHSKPHVTLPVDVCTILEKVPGDTICVTIRNAVGKIRTVHTVIHPGYKLYGKNISSHIDNSEHVEVIIDNTR